MGGVGEKSVGQEFVLFPQLFTSLTFAQGFLRPHVPTQPFFFFLCGAYVRFLKNALGGVNAACVCGSQGFYILIPAYTWPLEMD